jgi:hypothetical protein
MAKRTTSGERGVVGLVIVVSIGFLIYARLWRLALFDALAVFVPYLAFIAPFRCRETTRQYKACTFSRWGWFLGCGFHRWHRLRRVFSTLTGGRVSPEAQPLGQVAMASTPIPSRRPTPRQAMGPTGIASPRRTMYDRVMLATAIISAATGVITLWRS